MMAFIRAAFWMSYHGLDANCRFGGAAAALFFVLFTAHQYFDSLLLSFILVLVLMCVHTVYVLSLLKGMLMYPAREEFKSAIRWNYRKNDFLTWNLTGFVIMGIVLAVLIGLEVPLISVALEYREELRVIRLGMEPGAEVLEDPDYPRMLVFMGGAIGLAVLVLLLSLIWSSWFIRYSIIMPAAAIGFRLTFAEAQGMTLGFTRHIYYSNILINGTLVLIVYAVYQLLWDLDAIKGIWRDSLLATTVYWIGTWLNAALWSAVFESVSHDYRMKRIVY